MFSVHERTGGSGAAAARASYSADPGASTTASPHCGRGSLGTFWPVRICVFTPTSSMSGYAQHEGPEALQERAR